MLIVTLWRSRVPVKSSLVNWLTWWFSGSSVHFGVLLGYPRVGSVARARCCLCGADWRISSHSVAACVGGCTMIPHARGLGLGGGTNLPYGISQPTNSTVRLPRIQQG